jgi:type I restriction enzyme, R subunit
VSTQGRLFRRPKLFVLSRHSAIFHEVVQVIKRNLEVDWTQPHREDIKAAVRSAVRRVLRNNKIKAEDLEPFVARFMAQAESRYASRPVAV